MTYKCSHTFIAIVPGPVVSQRHICPTGNKCSGSCLLFLSSISQTLHVAIYKFPVKMQHVLPRKCLFDGVFRLSRTGTETETETWVRTMGDKMSLSPCPGPGVTWKLPNCFIQPICSGSLFQSRLRPVRIRFKTLHWPGYSPLPLYTNFTIDLLCVHFSIISQSGADTGFPVGGDANPWGGGANIQICRIFPKTAWN